MSVVGTIWDWGTSSVGLQPASPPYAHRLRNSAYKAKLLRCPRPLFVGLLCCLLLAVVGCDKPDGDKGKSADTTEESTGISKETTRGPVTVRLRTDRKELTIAERLALTLEVEYEEAYDIELPAFGEKLEQFGIVDYSTSQPELVGEGKVRVSRSYVLEPFLSGLYKIPPMTIAFQKKAGEDSKHEVATEEIEVEVTSLLQEDVENLKIADIAPPVEIPPPDRTWIWAVAGGVVLVIVVIATVVVLLGRKKPTVAAKPRIPAHELAFKQLQALVAEDLIEKGEIKLFYFKISNILRHYIENRFGLHAPEQTTEEFLHDLGNSRTLKDNHRGLLKTFLTHCDLVKFAEHSPDKKDIQETFDTCKTFITQTQAPSSQLSTPNSKLRTQTKEGQGANAHAV